MISAIGLRYARALAEAVLAHPDEISPEAALQQVRTFAAAVEDAPDLHRALLSPAVKLSRKRAVIARLGEPMGLSQIVQNFLFVIVGHRRVGILPSVAEGLEEIFDEHFGFARADISTARALDPAQVSSLERQLENITGKKIRPHYSVEPSLLGGAVARIGSTVYDGSVKGYFEQLRRGLVSESMPAEKII